MESNELNRILTNKGNCGKRFGGLEHLFITSSSSYFFIKTDFEQYFFNAVLNLIAHYITFLYYHSGGLLLEDFVTRSLLMSMRCLFYCLFALIYFILFALLVK